MSRPAPEGLLADVARELTHQGFPAMPARVLLALTASEEGRLTAEELATRLSASPAAISGAVRYLGTLGFVRAGTVPGSRRHVYSLPHTPWYTTTLNRPGLYDNLIALLDGAAGHLDQTSAARWRIEEMADFFRFLEHRLPQLLQEWHATRRPPGPDADADAAAG